MTMHTSPIHQLSPEETAFNNAMRFLDGEHKEILKLVCVKEFGYEQVSEMLQIPVREVRERLSDARASLQNLMSMAQQPKRNPPVPPAYWHDMPQEKTVAVM